MHNGGSTNKSLDDHNKGTLIMKHKTTGFTLIELILTLSIVSIILSLAIPSFTQFLDKSKVRANTQRLVQVLQLSRTTAISENVLVTVCPTDNGADCRSDWSQGYMSFKDNDGNRSFDSIDEKLFEFISNDEKSVISWRAFGIKSSLQWLTTGITNHQNGTFELCYDNNAELARGLFITKAGRIRYSKDTDNNGIHESTSGGTIDC
jgi:type IV fimbrial biogenesis protein FimT